jgi:probable phosphoglycerate mutase
MPRSRRPAVKPTLVLFVRHGQTPTTGRLLPGQAAGLHLADKGREQAEAAAGRIGAVKGVTAVYSSPLERTRETAAPIAKAVGARVRTDRRLLDADTGEWTGAELKALRRLPEWKTVQRYPSGFRFPGGESFPEVNARMAAVVDDLVRRHAGETIVVVSHADPIRLVITSALGAPLDLFQRAVVSPCSISAIAYGDEGPMVLCANSTGRDLAALAG